MFEEAGADALELNIYMLAMNPADTPASVEQRYVDILTSVREAVHIPIAVKVGPYFSAFARNHLVAHPQSDRRQDIALLPVHVV